MSLELKLMDLKFLLAVHRVLNLTPSRFFKLQKFFKNDWEKVFKAKISDLQQAELDPKGIAGFLSMRESVVPEKEIEKLKNCQAEVMIQGEKGFPEELINIPYAPVILFRRGELLKTDFPCVSVVGSRNISAYGRRALEYIVTDLARAGITIVSGLALGADTYAHRKALEHGARTICILGNGIDSIYPATNQKLGNQIWQQGKGAIISEYLPGIIPRPEYFPVRNRIISGLSKATIVIEAAPKSGSLITARTAIEQGREVFAVPGEIFTKNSRGTNELILYGGVHPALSGTQILEQLGFTGLIEKNQTQREKPTTEIEAEIIELFGNESRMHINDLICKSDRAGQEVSSNIAIMEIKGLLKNLGNQMYAKDF